ncbi:MAG TPA: hypothetical protein K8V47_00040, partial [Candidatus Amulumruptor caecigallinarius]|nr:hypothetical protein [Candidatus Amulumruptor caecigallinarius]
QSCLCDIPLLYKPMISSFSSNVLFINELHSKSFLSNFWGAVHTPVQPMQPPLSTHIRKAPGGSVKTIGRGASPVTQRTAKASPAVAGGASHNDAIRPAK